MNCSFPWFGLPQIVLVIPKVASWNDLLLVLADPGNPKPVQKKPDTPRQEGAGVAVRGDSATEITLEVGAAVVTVKLEARRDLIFESGNT